MLLSRFLISRQTRDDVRMMYVLRVMEQCVTTTVTTLVIVLPKYRLISKGKDVHSHASNAF